MATFNPVTEEEAKAGRLIPNGEYEFEIVKAEDKTSSAQNTYINLRLKVWDSLGKERTVFDRAMYSGGYAFKVRNLCYSIGMGDDYESGRLDPESMVGAVGRCRIGKEVDVQSGDDRNTVKDYLPPAKATTPAATPPTSQPKGGDAASTAQRIAAWGAFKTKHHTRIVDKSLEEDFKTLARSVVPGKTLGDLIAVDWMKVGKSIDGPPASPISEEPQFTEDDIPF